MTVPNQMEQAHGRRAPLPRWARIAVASVMLATAAAAVVTHDLLALWNMQARLERDAIHVAAAGVAFLPGAPARAKLAAAHSAALCGLSRLEVVHATAAADRMSFSVTLQGTAPMLVLRLLRAAGVTVTVLATAQVRPSVAPPDSNGSPDSRDTMVLSANATRGPRPRNAG